ncbi:trichohyalin [Diachasmimorpha longicaudata]|uniref:trichohyalin n=1 Tax=Diachasmimorpha longicaudata TaxID=58733 RepID=UPI0030B887B8
METEELTRLVDGIYKNILDKFNPGARQLINAGKAYLKALHGAAAASRTYVDALSRLARQAQLGTWGGSQDVGSALMRIVEVYKEIQEQEMNILKAFYVDLLVPLETNLEKDTKVVQSEQKKFLQQHKTRSETYSKAAATMKKQRKKSRGASKGGLAMDKELKNMQILEEEKSKLDAFCEQSLKNAMTQERRRYGFVLERQCSLAKHYASFHEVALAALHPSVDEWREVANTREYLPQSVEDMFASRLRQVSFWPEDEENGGSELTMSSQLRKTRSMDSSCLELRLGQPPSHPPSIHPNAGSHISSALSRARSEANLHASSLSLGPDVPETPPRPRSMAPASRNSVVGTSGTSGTGSSSGVWGETSLARALFAYLSSGENQLSFLEGDLIALMGDRQKGWQFGENLRTQSSGWFPLAYTEILIDDSLGSPNHAANNGRSPEPRAMPPCKPPPSRPPPSIDELSTIGNGNVGNNNNIGSGITSTPTNVPKSHSSYNVATPTGRQPKSIRPSGTLPSLLAGGRRVQPPVPPIPPPQAVTSLHSSNDSGFSNEPPVQPDIDYSDDEAMRQRRRKTRGDRLEAAERAMQQQQQQQNQSPQQRDADDKNKDWENDSWKTIPRDEKSWNMYRNSMEMWSESKHQTTNKGGDLEGRYTSANGRRRGDTQDPQRKLDPELRDKRERKGESTRKSDYEQSRGRQEIERNGRYTNGDERPRESSRRSHEDRRENVKRERDMDESDEEDREINNDEEETYVTNNYSDKFEDKKYYDNHDNNHNERYQSNDRDRESHKYENEKSESVSSASDSEDASTITIPETGRKVEHIAQKLEQTAQKYAREHSPPKFVERRREEYTKSLDREKPPSYEKYERDARATQSRDRFERDRYQEKNHQTTYERERTFEKNPDRKKNVERNSNRRFERPRPPFEDAPERPRDKPYRERRYSEKEEIYGEPGRFSRTPGTLEKDRGYESNFETKLERSKVIEKVQVAYRQNEPSEDRKREPSDTRSPERNDTNNNTLNNDRKNLPRQSTALGHLVQTGRAYDIDMKSPKLVKRTKSFWRFRRDSEVLEGMALWQHRSLVDIPKMVKREDKDHKIKDDSEMSRKSSPDNNSGSGRSIGKDSRSSDNTLTNDRSPTRDHEREEPKPAERSLVPDKSDYFDDFPTPAERPKAVERSEYRVQREERSYFVGNVSRKAILEKERKRSLEAKRNMVVAELKENNEAKKGERRMKSYGDDDDGLIQNFSETEASDEESTYSCIVVKEQAEKTLLPRTKLRRDSDREREKNTCGPWYDLWGVDASVNNKKKKK